MLQVLWCTPDVSVDAFQWVMKCGQWQTSRLGVTLCRHTTFHPPDLVSPAGTWAEYVVISERRTRLKPTNINFEEAGSMPLVLTTSYEALIVEGQLKGGQKLLVLGGATATGNLFLVMLQECALPIALPQ